MPISWRRAALRRPRARSASPTPCALPRCLTLTRTSGSAKSGAEVDPFAGVRAAALKLRADAEITEDMRAPEAARKAAMQRGLTIRELPAGDGELQGAIGLFDRRYKLILVQDEPDCSHRKSVV